MYLVSQMWGLLLLAFLLGLLVGYILWRACGRRRIEANNDRSRQDLLSRLDALEHERQTFSDTAIDSERETGRHAGEIKTLRGELARLKGEEGKRDN